MKQSQSILFLTRLYHPHIGGVEKHVEEVASALLKKGKSVTVVTEQYSKGLPVFERRKGIEIWRIPVQSDTYAKKFFIWKWILLHLNLFFKADIIHIHDVFYWIIPYRLFLPTKRIFITFHGYEGFPVKISWKIQRKLAETLTNGNICVGDFMKKWYSTVPTSVIYGAVRLIDKKYKQQEQSAVFFGRLDSQTGIPEYVKAYRKIKEKYPKFRFTIVGEGELKKKIPKDIKIKKFSLDISRYIGENRFIFVSRYLSMLEALIQKKEILAVYNSPIMKDYLLMSPFAKYIAIGATGEEIADHVIKSLETKNTYRRIEEGFQWAKKQTWEKITTVYLKLWKFE